MVEVILSSTGKDLTMEDITNLEKTLKLTFPDDYRSFLLKNNGGEPDRTLYKFNENGRESEDIIHFFIGIVPDKDYSDLEYQANYFHSQDRIPKRLIPIACDPGGNLILMGVKGPQRNKVYFWDHETEYEEGQIAGYRNVYLIANTFTEFLEMLEKNPYEDEE